MGTRNRQVLVEYRPRGKRRNDGKRKVTVKGRGGNFSASSPVQKRPRKRSPLRPIARTHFEMRYNKNIILLSACIIDEIARLGLAEAVITLFCGLITYVLSVRRIVQLQSPQVDAGEFRLLSDVVS